MKTTFLLTVLTLVQLVSSLRAGGDDAKSFTVHEWGTFTSVQGADGVQLAWNPLSVSELPTFVYSRQRPTRSTPPGGLAYLAGKVGLLTLQRMETPVLYFYSDRDRTVDVAVQFPQGIVTEWYPQIRAEGRALSNLFGGPRAIRWDEVQIKPRLRYETLRGLLPGDASGSHYYAARETEADFLQLRAESTGPHAVETEKFLFYRGVGNFRAPLTVTQSGSDAESVQLQNNGGEELRHLFVYAVRQGRGKFVFVPELPPGGSRAVKLAPAQGLAPLSETRVDAEKEMAAALVREGLFPAEARAMVKTWDDSWFAESGVRVLYTLPRAWTDRILPLSVTPAPAEAVRVMVGRAELITPSMEWDLMKEIVRYRDADGAARLRIAEQTRQLGLGRFLEPAGRRLQEKLPAPEFVSAAAELIREAAKPSGRGKGLATR